MDKIKGEYKLDVDYVVLQQKIIYEFLEGSGDNELVTYNGKPYGLPYLSGSDLYSMCLSFGIVDPPQGSRWTLVERLFEFAIENNRCDELLNYFFELDRFNNLQEIESMEEVEKLHRKIVEAAVKKINQIIRLSRKELVNVDSHYYIVCVRQKLVLETPKVDTLSLDYVRNLRERCIIDFDSGNYDSVITKSRTMMEEVLIHIIETAGENPSETGNINDLYKQVKVIRNMNQRKEFDNRINGLLSGLEKIVQNIGNMRNISSDAHGVGSKRISIKEKEARLVMNSAVSFCEYLL